MSGCSSFPRALHARVSQPSVFRNECSRCSGIGSFLRLKGLEFITTNTPSASGGPAAPDGLDHVADCVSEPPPQSSFFRYVVVGLRRPGEDLGRGRGLRRGGALTLAEGGEGGGGVRAEGRARAGDGEQRSEAEGEKRVLRVAPSRVFATAAARHQRRGLVRAHGCLPSAHVARANQPRGRRDARAPAG